MAQKIEVERISPEFPLWGVISIEAATETEWIARLREAVTSFERHRKPVQGITLLDKATSQVIRPEWQD